jgi:hypothetical protein
MKKFTKSMIWGKPYPEEFTEETAPAWLTSCNTVPGSTMDNRWFWEERVLTLEIGEYIDTDFTRITRIE